LAGRRVGGARPETPVEGGGGLIWKSFFVFSFVLPRGQT